MKKVKTVAFLLSLLVALSILPSAIGENTPATAVAQKPTLSPSLADMPAGLTPSAPVLPPFFVRREGLTAGETSFAGYTRVAAEAGSSSADQQFGQRPQVEAYKPNQVIIKLKEKESLETLTRQPYSQRMQKHQSLLSGLKSRHALKNEKPVFSSLHQELKSRNLTQETLSREIQARRLKGRKSLAPVKESVDLLPVYVLETERKDIPGLCKELKKDPDIEYAQPNYIYTTLMTPNDPDYDDLWGLQADKLDCAPAWDISKGEGVVVAVVDTGIDYNHEDLWDNIWVNPEVISDVNEDGRIDLDDCDTDEDHQIESSEIVDHMFGWDYAYNDNNPMDGFGHGTHCAGTIAGVGNNSLGVIGVAPQARLMPVKGLDDGGGGWTDDLADGLRYAADHGADVLSNSWGGSYPSNPTLESAVDYAYGLGCVVVFAAGNETVDIDGRSPLNHHYLYNPANPLTVMAVAATNSDDSRAYFSNGGEKLSVAAPGVGILSTLPGDAYGSYNGTSMACPHVAGLAALVIARYPILGNEGVRTMIESYADDLGDTGKDIYFGWGRINAYQSVSQELPALQCSLSAFPSGGREPFSTTFGLSINRRPEEIVSWGFVYGDGASTGGNGAPPVTVTHAYQDTGTYTATLTVTDNEDDTAEDNQTIVVRDPINFRVPSEYSTIQAAIDAALNGDTVLVADGTYTGSGNRNLTWNGSLKQITVKSENGPEDCIIDCQGNGRGFYFSENNQDIIDGFTITHGYALYGGGGIRCCLASPTIQNCIITGNIGSNWTGSAGIYCGAYASPLIQNCVITGNYSQYFYGGGIYCELSSPLIQDCVIAGNYSGYGGSGITSNTGASPTFRNCSITANSTPGHVVIENGWMSVAGGGGILSFWGSSPVFQNCIIAGNSAGSGGGIFACFSAPTLQNCVIAGNNASQDGAGIGCYSYASPPIENCTIAGNGGGGAGAGIFYYDQSYPQVVNSILWNDGSEVVPEIPSDAINVTYSDVRGGYPGAGNIHSDPLFLGGPSGDWEGVSYNSATFQTTFTDSDAGFTSGELIGKLLNPDTAQPLQYSIVANTATTITVWSDLSSVAVDSDYQVYDYHLDVFSPFSPCIDIAKGSAAPETDRDGNPRYDFPAVPNGRAAGTPPVDMGAYEAQTQPEPLFCFLSADRLYGCPPLPVTFTLRAGDFESGIDCWELDYGDGTSDSGSGTPPATLTHTYSDAGTYEANLAVTNGAEEMLSDSLAITIRQALRVPSQYSTIQAAIDAATDMDTVLVADGTYTGTGNRNLTWDGSSKHITVKSENGPEDCIIDCQGNGPGFEFLSSSQDEQDIIDGFTITRGYSNGIYCEFSSPLIQNCVIAGNGVDYWGGGGIGCAVSSPLIQNCVITGNSGDYGGSGIGCWSYSCPAIQNCIITGNTADYYHGGGGIMCDYYSSPDIQNCVIAGNSAYFESSNGGGIWCNDNSSPIITNCTIAGNSSGGGDAIFCGYYSSAGITNSILWNGNSEIELDSESSITVTYSDVKAGYTGTGNINSDPLFVGGPAGNWEEISYNFATFQTTFTDSDAAFGNLAGKLLNPDITQKCQYPIVANTATTITVWGDLSSVEEDSEYQVCDYHLSVSAACSPCIDVADGSVAPLTDKDGHSRFDYPGISNGPEAGNPPADIGAYEVVLADFKAAVIAELNNYVNLGNYRSAERAQVEAAIAAGTAAINDAEDVSEVNEALADAEAAIDAIPTAEYTLTINVNPAQVGTVSRDPDKQTYDYLDQVTLTANPANGAAFDSWSGDASGSENPKTVTIYGDTSVTANFVFTPPLIWSTFLGGGNDEAGYSIAIDSAGCVYVTGETHSSNFPTRSGYDATFTGYSDAFVTKFKADGTNIVYSTFIGGGQGYGADYGHEIVVNNAGEAYVAGKTFCSDFPTTSGAYDTTLNGGSDIFVTEFNASGTGLVFSTLLGGSDYDVASGLALDSAGSVYVAGSTGSSNFPATSGSLQGSWDVVVCKLDDDGSDLVYGIYLGEDSSNGGAGCLAVDSTGCAYVTGETAGVFPATSGAFDESYNGGGDAFVTKLNSAGDSLVYSSFLGGDKADSGRGISLDSSGCVYVTGKMKSRDLATSGAYQETPGYRSDAFVAKLNAGGSALGFFTYLGGNNNDWGTGIAVDSSGDILLAGGTCSSDFPVTEGTFECVFPGGNDVFVARFDSDGSNLEYSTYLGGSEFLDRAEGKVEVDSFGCAYVTGYTGSNDFPTTSGAYDVTKNGGNDVFVTKLSMVASPAVYSVDVSVSPSNGGSVSKDPDRLYGYGAKVELTASPASGYAFNYWGGDASGSQNPRTIMVTGDMNVTAYFVQGGYSLTTSVSPSGSGWVYRSPDKAIYSANEVVTLTASPDYGYGFDYWSGDVGGNQRPKTITMTGNASVTANFYWGGPCW